MKTEYVVHIPPHVQRRILRLRASVRKQIAEGLVEVVQDARGAHLEGLPRQVGPPLRFYVEGQRVFYRVDADVHRVIVIDVRKAFA